MATRVIGLDIGTTAVRAAELRGKDPATVVRFAQLALDQGAVTAGEVSDPAVVSVTLKELWQRGGFSKKKVALAVSNQNVIVRQIDMPRMDEEELRSALQFQVQDYIPIPTEDAILDFLMLEEFLGEEDVPMMRVLAVAAHKEMVGRLIEAVEGAGLEPVSVDVGPLAALRAMVDPAVGWGDDIRAAAVVDIGGGVTTVTVHESGNPRFVRVLTAGGNDITAALVSELGLSTEEAEVRKLGSTLQPEGASVESGAPTIIENRAQAFIDDVRRSIEYYQSQPGAGRVGRVVLTGGGARLRRLPERMATALQIPVEQGLAFSRIKVGDLGFEPEQLEQVEAVGAVAIGLALEDR